MIGNAGRIIRGERFRFYAEGFTKPVIGMLMDVEDVRCKVREILGFSKVDPLGLVHKIYGTKFETFEQFGNGSVVHNKFEAPSTLHHRMLVEDVRIHWVLWHEIAKLLGLDRTPLTRGIETASSLLGENLFKSGLTLEKLRLGNYLRAAFVKKFSA
ncbi:Protein ocs [Paramyrothecium foliicola]|nr:Protein ocs [Paramyrothecium foliicola]